MIQSIDKTIYSCPLFEAPTKNGHCIRPYTLLMHGNSPRLFKVMLRNRHVRMTRTPSKTPMVYYRYAYYRSILNTPILFPLVA